VRKFCIDGGAVLLLPFALSAQTADFQIVWINVGEVAAPTNGQLPRVGRQLFMAPDLVQFSLKKVVVARVEVEPSIIALKTGDKFCLTSLHVIVNAHDRSEVENAPLSVSVRQDQRERLSMKREKNDICFTPTSAGEYPVRFNSMLPARDGTTRGAQIFLRVQEQNVERRDPTVNTASAGKDGPPSSRTTLYTAS
jgi:hypothetical protein